MLDFVGFMPDAIVKYLDFCAVFIYTLRDTDKLNGEGYEF